MENAGDRGHVVGGGLAVLVEHGESRAAHGGSRREDAEVIRARGEPVFGPAVEHGRGRNLGDRAAASVAQHEAPHCGVAGGLEQLVGLIDPRSIAERSIPEKSRRTATHDWFPLPAR